MRGSLRATAFGLLLAVAGAAGLAARAAEPIDWSALQPPAAPEDNPFERLTPAQLDRITELALGHVLEQRGRPSTAAMLERRRALVAALAADGLDAAALLQARERLMADRRAAATGVVDAMTGRAVRLEGYLVPASADGRTITDLLFVPWAGACSHTPQPPPNQIVRLPAGALPGVQGAPFERVRLVGRLRILAQETRMRVVDGELVVRSAYTADEVRIASAGSEPISTCPIGQCPDPIATRDTPTH